MCTALLDPERRFWTREDWETYNKEDVEFSEKFKCAMIRGNLDEIDDLIEEGKNYYHFPDVASMQILFSENLDLYLSVMNKRNLFYKYDSIS